MRPGEYECTFRNDTGKPVAVGDIVMTEGYRYIIALEATGPGAIGAGITHYKGVLDGVSAGSPRLSPHLTETQRDELEREAQRKLAT